MSNKEWPEMDDDAMQLGDSGFVLEKDGWLRNHITGEMISPDGKHFHESDADED